MGAGGVGIGPRVRYEGWGPAGRQCQTPTILYEKKTTIKKYILQSAKNDVLLNNFILLQCTRIHYTQCISQIFFCQIFLCSSIHNVFGYAEIQGGAKTDFYAQNDTDVVSLIQLFVLVVFCCDLCTNQLNWLKRWFCNQVG